MYKIFDKFLKEKNFNFRSELVDEQKLYLINEKIDGNVISFLISVGENNVYHSVGCRLIENFDSDKKIDFIRLANEYNLKYKNLCCVVLEDNHFEVNCYYIASKETFDAELFLNVMSSFVNILKDGLLKEALKLKYS